MVALAILRVEKLKSLSNVGSSEKHTARLQDTPNADPTKKNIRLIGELDDLPLNEIVKTKIATSTKHKPRKDAVLCSDIFLSASPEYFRPHDPSLAGEWDNNRMLDFANASKNWLISNYGDKCVRAELHLDEVTPHIHAYIIPINDKTKQLSHKAMFGGDGKQASIKLSKLQDSYAAALAPLGIERGVKGSKATHTKVKKYYQAVNSEPLNLELERFAPQPGETAQQLYERIKADRAIQDINHQLADRRLLLEQLRAAEQKANASEKLRQQLEQRVTQLEDEKIIWNQQAEQLRDLPLEDVAWQLGLDRDHKQPGKWRGQGNNMNINGSKFYDFHPSEQRGGGGAIDLVMHVNQCDYRQAMAWLHDSFGERGLRRAVIAQAQKIATGFAQFEPRPKFVTPAPDERQWHKVENYLTQKRELLPSFIQAVHEQGLIYADEQQNAVFLMRNLDGETTGAFLRGTQGEDNTFQGYVKGTKRTQGWFHLKLGGEPNGEIEKVVLCKSPIEALSFATLEMEVQQGIPKTRTMYMAVDSPKSLPVEFLRTVPAVEVAYDNDHAGNETARMIMEQLHHAMRVKPKGKDWNETLCAWRKYQKQQRRDQQHQQPGQELEF
ncbi:MobV family relaxase [Nodularia sp. UHCC 0506]|uniref:MobV family relaxase n=1 Tax=Nodularia sp. UHCC 0506 TaxID=3110243 RepID=UPI002B2065EB|nr:MobV family relaxase [Nodularia sp. UHCC 0506]MEA5515747.1 MobV family relaxase [Nodularia sp. UHCC 0506]